MQGSCYNRKVDDVREDVRASEWKIQDKYTSV